jgi:hypothetical protein
MRSVISGGVCVLVAVACLAVAPIASARTVHCANHFDPWHTALIKHEYATNVSCAAAAPLCISYNIPLAPEPYRYHGQLWLFRLRNHMRGGTYLYEHVVVQREHSSQRLVFDAFPKSG